MLSHAYNCCKFPEPATYSVLNDLIGFAVAALIAWKLTVINVMVSAPAVANKKIHYEMVAW